MSSLPTEKLTAKKMSFLAGMALILILSANPSHAQVIEVELHQIKELSQQYSPQWQQFENRFNYSAEGERASATRLNPSLAYDLEHLDIGGESEYEHYLYLQKEFRTPGHYRNLRERRDSRIDLYDYQAETERAEWLSATRLGFIEIVLGKQEVEQLKEMMDQLQRLADASEQIAGEGEASVLDNQMIKMSLYQLEARIDKRKLENDHLIALWRNRMGFDEETEIHFTGNFQQTDVQLPETAELLTILDQSPEMDAYRKAVETAAVEEAFARSSRFPSLELSAGYKQLNRNWRGFLVGIAVPLPILNSSSEAISQARALQQIEETNLTQAQIERNQNTFRILNAIQHYEEQLERFPDHLNQPERFLNALSISYEEGTQSLSGFLNTLGLMADTYQTKFSQLSEYYSMIMELEAMSGREFINQ
ncbi:MAG: TolC family protein [Balneolaceae bacterium]|nr:TolC family protein [Balneolaceae bacterium]MCH8548987.1 TolC family protein [Balneolaceae bacterium]